MKILYADFYCNNWGQKKMNTVLITLLSSFSEVHVLSQKNWYRGLPSDVKIFEMPKEMYRMGRIGSRTNSLRIMYKAWRMDYKEKYDILFAASYETFAFGIGRLFFPRVDRFYLIHNNNLDLINRKVIDLIFKSYINKVHHFPLEEFIGEYLEDNYKIKHNMIHPLPHPMPPVTTIEKKEKKIDCLGISNSNDENLIQNIIIREKKTQFLKRLNLHIVLRSKNSQFDDGNLKVINNYLTNEEYCDYLEIAAVMLIPFPLTFRNRMSGTIIDALSNHIKIVGTDIPAMRVYENQYPHLCKVFHDEDELIESILTLRNSSSEDFPEFTDFEKAHSNHKITILLKLLFTGKREV